MIRITKLTDYGIVLLTHMAGHPERQTHNAPELSEETCIPLPMVSKVLKVLVRAELLVSHRGVKGGYGLARASATITVLEIIRALEGPIAITECSEHEPSECVVETVCPVRGNWNLINRAVESALEGITLDVMARPLGARTITFGGAKRTFTEVS